MKIGITERGDAGIDLSWVNKLDTVDSAILITKNITPDFINAVINSCKEGYKIIVHATCTGWGNTDMEPNVPYYKEQLNNLSTLIKSGFPISNCVLRIDPIIPNKEGIDRADLVMSEAFSMGLLPCMRVRISVLDEYKHVKKRFTEMGIKPIYGDKFYCPDHMLRSVYNMISKYHKTVECCAEPGLVEIDPYLFSEMGCVSTYDLSIMGLPGLEAYEMMKKNPQNRKGCLCLSCKTELLSCKSRCSNKCAYCYWKDN